MSDQKMREEFEAWKSSYDFNTSTTMFEVWKASRKAMVIEIPEDFTSGASQNMRMLVAHHREIAGRWVQSIEAAGVELKS